MTAHLPPTGATPPPPDSDLRDEPNPGTGAQNVPLDSAPIMAPPGPPPGYTPEPASGSRSAPTAPPASPFAGPAAGSPFTAPPGSPYPQPYPSRVPVPGRNGLAIAALCCGIAGIVPVAAVVGIVLGAVALAQLRRRLQKGKGMAIAGIVLGVLWLVGWAALIVFAANDAPAPAPSAAPVTVTQRHEVFVEALKAGDCFSGGRKDNVDLVTVMACTSPHESQVITTFELPAGPYPGDKAVSDAAEKGCTDKGDPLVTDKALNELEPSSISPSDAYTWRGNRTVVCVAEAPTGTTTGSALR